MRISIGEPLPISAADGEDEGWRPIDAPSPRKGQLLAAALGIALMTTLVGLLIVDSVVRPTPAYARELTTSALAALLAFVFLLFIPLHELLHLIWHPRRGLSDRSRVVIWPSRLRVGVYFEGVLSRSRWLAMRTSAFLLLSVLPAIFLLSPLRLSLELEAAISMLMVLNALGSGGDALAVLLVLSQVPAAGRIRFQGGRAGWQPS
jgi:hypothetical protein